MRHHSNAPECIPKGSGRRRGRPRRPPIPPYVPFGIRRFLSVRSFGDLVASCPIGTRLYLADSVRYFQPRPSSEAYTQNSQRSSLELRDRFSPSSRWWRNYYGLCWLLPIHRVTLRPR